MHYRCDALSRSRSCTQVRDAGLPNPTQAAVTESMDAMVRREFTVDGIPTSLADLGYTRASVDGRYIACVPDDANMCGFDCGGVNGS
jgi:hypothetical protein